jgi:DnaJ-domain-containing protein 1
MIVRFYFSDRDVTAALAKAVETWPRILLVTQLQGDRKLALEERPPFPQIFASAGERVDLAAVIDEGLAEGMWRDPVGELCDRLFPVRSDASAAATGYILTSQGTALAHFKKALWDPLEDAEVITAYLTQIFPSLEPFLRHRPEEALRGDPDPSRVDTQELPAFRLEPEPLDPYAILGVRRDADFAAIKQAYRKHMVSYHPDKVARLSDAVREEAESKARDLNVAFDLIKKLHAP